AQGILHRDIKPANLLLDLQGTVWVTDFGLAKSNDADNLTERGDIVGTLRYMAPERFDGAGDHRADLYALGLTLYEMLTLKLAFHAENRVKLIEQVTAASPPRPRAINPAIPRDLETIVLKAIQRDPALRYQSAEEARKRLTRLYVFTGVRYQDDRDIPAALLWFHRAWEQDHSDPTADAAHRTRIAGALAEMPDLIGACFHKTKVCDAIFSPDG